MDTQEGSKELFRFIVLIPHKDALGPFFLYREKLFSLGYYGAHSFPMAAPLAVVSRHLSRNELKELGRNIRNCINEKDGKIKDRGTGQANYGGKFTFFGPCLNFRIEENMFPKTARAKIIHIPESSVLCAALLGSEEKPDSEEGPTLSFRAASLANLTMRPLDCGASGYSFEWRIGSPVWLPKYPV